MPLLVGYARVRSLLTALKILQSASGVPWPAYCGGIPLSAPTPDAKDVRPVHLVDLKTGQKRKEYKEIPRSARLAVKERRRATNNRNKETGWPRTDPYHC